MAWIAFPRHRVHGLKTLKWTDHMPFSKQNASVVRCCWNRIVFV